MAKKLIQSSKPNPMMIRAKKDAVFYISSLESGFGHEQIAVIMIDHILGCTTQ